MDYRAVASRQDCLITARQCMGVGLRPDDVKTRVRRGEWIALARGVYLIDADTRWDALEPRVWWRAALLSYGDDTCLVATTAVAARGVEGLPPGRHPIEIAKIGGGMRRNRQTDDRVR